MGFNIAWIALRGKEPRELLSGLKLRPTGEFCEIPDEPFVGCQLPGDWYLVWADGCDSFASEELVAELSAGGELVTCAIEEHVMFSSASHVKDGKLLWRVTHEAERGIDHLETQGEMPPEFASIHQQQSEQQAASGDDGVDYLFEVPVEMARLLTGFRYDEDVPGLTGEVFETLVSD